MSLKSTCLAATGLILGAAALSAQAQYSTPMRDVENPDRAPYVQYATASLPTPYLNGFASFPTPVGKRYVIDYVAVSCSTPSASDSFPQVYATVTKIVSANQTNGYSFPAVVKLEPHGSAVFGGGYLWQGAAQVRLVSDASPFDANGGTGIVLNIFHTDTTVAANCSATVSGHTLTL